MKKWTRNLAMIAGSLLLVGASACVEQEPSISLRGSLQFEGEVSEEGLTCEVTYDPESVDTVSERGQVDITQLETVGQQGPPFETLDHHPSFVFWAGITNLLEESTQVGAGGGGSGDNFQGLQADQNYIMVTAATIRYPEDLNNFAGGEFAKSLEKKELFSSVIESNGGGTIVNFPIFSQREIGKLKTFYRNAIDASPNVPSGTEDAIIPLIAEIQIEGETFSGREVESNKFQFPIDVCMNCDDMVTLTMPNGMERTVRKFETTSTCTARWSRPEEEEEETEE